jgi:3-oxocholest-4-en-26-oate---CoA ligase
MRSGIARSLARYKLPKAFVRVPEVRRHPNGKPDYRWARRTAEESA